MSLTSPYTVCDYISRTGVCGRRCYGGRCFAHRTRKSHTWCLKECGRATQSRTGYCSHCGWAQNDHGHKMKRQERAMDAYVDALINSFDASKISPCPAPTATSVTSR